jgi:hypothetical protein
VRWELRFAEEATKKRQRNFLGNDAYTVPVACRHRRSATLIQLIRVSALQRSLAPGIREIRDQSVLWPAEVIRTRNGAEEIIRIKGSEHLIAMTSAAI